jgi:hypothetical protein
MIDNESESVTIRCGTLWVYQGWYIRLYLSRRSKKSESWNTLEIHAQINEAIVGKIVRDFDTLMRGESAVP